jgi:hypothetical protein
MAYAIGNGRWRALDVGSIPMLGIKMQVGDLIRCKSCITPVEDFYMRFVDGPHLVGIRCPTCHRWRALTAEGPSEGE